MNYFTFTKLRKNRYERRKLRRKKISFQHTINTKKLLISITLISITLLSLYVIKINPLRLSQIIIHSPRLLCVDKEKLDQTTPLQNQNYLFFNGKKTTQQLETSYPCIKTITITKQFPNTINLSITPRNPFAEIDATTSAQALINLMPFESSQSAEEEIVSNLNLNYLVDDEGVIISPGQESTILHINLIVDKDKLPLKGKWQNLKSAFSLIKALDQKNIPHDLITISQTSMYIINEQNISSSTPKVLILSLDKDLDAQIAALDLIVQKAKIEIKAIDKLDLRFEKAVVVYGKR